MASNRCKEIAIIGADSTHVSAFTRLINKEKINSDYRVKTVYVDRRSDLPMSVNRIETILNVLNTLDVNIVEGIEDIEDHDAFMILGVDANYHLDSLEAIKHFNKPIFVDKPLVYQLDELAQIEKYVTEKGLKIFSASALRFTPFIQRLKAEISDKTNLIQIKAPFYLEDDIPAFHWYGIHALSMLQGLSDQTIDIISLNLQGDIYILKGTVDHIPFEIELFTKNMHEFSAIIKNEDRAIEDALINDPNPLYSYLLKEVLVFFETNTAPITFTETKALLVLCDQLNHML